MSGSASMVSSLQVVGMMQARFCSNTEHRPENMVFGSWEGVATSCFQSRLQNGARVGGAVLVDLGVGVGGATGWVPPRLVLGVGEHLMAPELLLGRGARGPRGARPRGGVAAKPKKLQGTWQ